MVCVFFGHRDAPGSVREKLEEVIQQLIQEGVIQFLVGNQGSFDAMALGVLREMAARHPQISYHVVLAYLPERTAGDCRFGETVFPEGQELVHPRYAISRRNRWMVEQADIVVAYVIHDWGGAAGTVANAKRKGKKIIHLYEKSS